MHSQGTASELQRAFSLLSQGAFTAAEQVARPILQVIPNSVEAMIVLAICAQSLGRLEEAVTWNTRAIALNRGIPETWSNRGVARMLLGEFDLALEDFAVALALRPNFPEAVSNRGAVFSTLYRPVEALQCFEQALALRPEFPDALSGRGYALYELGRHTEARQSCESALKLQPRHKDAWNNLGLILLNLSNFAGAEDALRRALEIDPDHSDAIYNRGLVRHKLSNFTGAIDDFVRVRQLRPGKIGLPGQLLHTRMHLCDWADFDELVKECREGFAQGQIPATPLQIMSVSNDPGEILDASVAMTKRLDARQEQHRHSAVTQPSFGARPRGPLKVAYISADYRDHPCARMIVELIERHDRRNVIPVGVSIGPCDDGPVGGRVKQAFEEFVDLSAPTTEGRLPSDREIADHISRMNADIAVDLMGHTHLSRPGIFLHRPAPVQINFLGYPGSSGMAAIDYIIVDPNIAGPEDQKFYTERLCWMPGSYLPTTASVAIGEMSTRTASGLPEDAFVFASFNTLWKITPTMFMAWMRLLHACEKSVLWLSANNDLAQKNLRRAAAAQGVEPNRLIFASRVEAHSDHLARQRCADLFLDTSPYNAHSTGCDALLANLPIVTLRGATFSGRVGASLLNAIGLPELVATSIGDYEAIARGLYRDPTALANIRARLASHIQTHSLFDMTTYTRQIERAYGQMMRRCRAGEAPLSFEVAQLPKPSAVGSPW